MRFRKELRAETGLQHLVVVPLINIVLLLLIFFMLASGFNSIPGISVQLSNFITSETIPPQTLTITISDTNGLHIGPKEVTLAEIASVLADGKYQAILVRAGPQTNIEILTLLWEVCKQAGVETIGVATARAA